MSKKSSQTNSLKALAAKSDSEIDYSDIAELDTEFWDKAVVHPPENKQRITVRFDADMVRWFKAQGRGYQSRMNAVLRSFYESQR